MCDSCLMMAIKGTTKRRVGGCVVVVVVVVGCNLWSPSVNVLASPPPLVPAAAATHTALKSVWHGPLMLFAAAASRALFSFRSFSFVLLCAKRLYRAHVSHDRIDFHIASLYSARNEKERKKERTNERQKERREKKGSFACCQLCGAAASAVIYPRPLPL